MGAPFHATPPWCERGGLLFVNYLVLPILRHAEDWYLPDSYFFQVSFLRCAPFQSGAVVISRDTPRFDFNQIGLSPEAAKMAGVQVMAERVDVSFESINMDYALTKQSIFSVSGLISRRDGDSNDLNRHKAMDLLSDPIELIDRLSVSEGAGTNMDFSTGPEVPALRALRDPS